MMTETVLCSPLLCAQCVYFETRPADRERRKGIWLQDGIVMRFWELPGM